MPSPGMAALEADRTFEALRAHLEERGAGALPHAGGRTLLDHLLGTAAILRRWGQPAWVQHAALIHSVYGTDRYRRRLLTEEERPALAAIAGADAERLAHRFAATPRGALLAGTLRWADPALGSDHDWLVILHMGNLAEQAAAANGSPARWLVELRRLAELIIDSETVALPDLIAPLMALSEEDEQRALDAYRAGLAAADHETRRANLALAAAINPVIPEPCVELAGAAWLTQARRRLSLLGTTWDKRRSYEELSALIDAGGPEAGSSAPAISGGRERFHRYVDSFAGARTAGRVYPDLPSRPWHDPCEFPLARHLEEHQAEIRDEILALDPSVFHRESERIERSGDWDVAFLYERGRRHDATCAACPAATRAIETPGHRAIRTPSGLIYASRMRPGTHIAAHRGPTNVRLRCHLGIQVPDGDCAIRVGDEVRRWEDGKCLVFDDHFEHEAWNHTGEDRIVLIVDLWHPALSQEEIDLLEGLQGHIHGHALRLLRYWRGNAAAAAGPRPPAPG